MTLNMIKVFKNMCRHEKYRVQKAKGSSITMGMAASQARFLGLTARKNNVEFEGQQVNQQRTALSNQSASYYNDLLGMSVPIPPSVDNYTKTVYTFADGALTNQITAMLAQPNGTYKVSYLRQWTDDYAVVSAATSIVNKQGNEPNFKYFVGSQELRKLAAIDEMRQEFVGYQIDGHDLTFVNDDFYNDENENGIQDEDESTYKLYTYENNGNTVSFYYSQKDNIWADSDYNVLDETKSPKAMYVDVYAGNDEYLKSLSQDQLKSHIEEEKAYLQMLQSKYGIGDYYVRYLKNSTTGEYNPYFYNGENLENAAYDANGNSQSNINCYKIGSETKSEEIKAVSGCKIEKDSSGRYINITMPQHDAQGNVVEGADITYALTTSTVTDQEKYDDAMNQYEFEKYQYDQAIQDINSKIEIIQAQDKNLELRLKQLDTEQKAIQAETEAITQVIQKNTESSFKTFG